jgi:hypothetical protein
MNDQGQVLLDGGFAPPEPDEDSPTIMATATPALQVSELSPSPLAQHSSPIGREIPVLGKAATAGRSMARSLSRAVSVGEHRWRTMLAG